MDRFFYGLECYLNEKTITRNTFLKLCATTGLALLSGNTFLKRAFAKETPSKGRSKKNIKGDYDLVSCDGKDPYRNTVNAVKKLGGMERFVKRGATVVVKPNIGWDRVPDQAANTEPLVVAALVDLCYKAGAKTVKVFDISCNTAKLCYQNSGIAEAARKKGAQVFFADEWNMVKAQFPYDSPMDQWPLLRDAVECDTFINVPVIKQHSLTNWTLSMKNLMGVCGGHRELMHIKISQKIADLADFIAPELTVVDATRVLLRNGPAGGDLKDVERRDIVFATTDPVLADSYACSLMHVHPLRVPYIELAAARKLGSMDTRKAKILKIHA